LDQLEYDSKVTKDDDYGMTECVICIEEFKQKDRLLRIPTCKHFFHYECGKKWFDSKVQESEQKCPCCNKNLVLEELLASKGMSLPAPVHPWEN
tara:strand:- start:303 stop:584 length:282 start_codon:yes stop_codon:yes gene_type:complete